MMTRRDFEAIAHEINYSSATRAEARRIIKIIAPALKSSAGLTSNGNSRFDQDRFEEAATKRWGS